MIPFAFIQQWAAAAIGSSTLTTMLSSSSSGSSWSSSQQHTRKQPHNPVHNSAPCAHLHHTRHIHQVWCAPRTPAAAVAAAAAEAVPSSQSLAAATNTSSKPHIAPVQFDPETKARHKRPIGWIAPGPQPAAAAAAFGLQASDDLQQQQQQQQLCPGPNETLSYLTGDWRIFQLRNGHRWSMDDMLTAYVALQTVQQQQQLQQQQQQQQHNLTPTPQAAAAAVNRSSCLDRTHSFIISDVLDLGCGIGSVLLMVAWGLRRMHMDQQQSQQLQQQSHQQQSHQHQSQQQQQLFPIRSFGVEAQAVSYQLALRSLQYNLGGAGTGCDHQVQVCHQDLRAPLPSHWPRQYQLVTGTPPYIPPGAGGQSNKPQKGPCCVEIRGGIEDYCQAAAAVLAPGGHFIVCCGLQGQPFKGSRAQRAAAAAGLVITRQVTVVTREGKPPLFAVYVMQAAADVLLAAAALSAETGRRQQQQQHGGMSSSINTDSSSSSNNSLQAQVSAGQLSGVEEVFVVRCAEGRHTPAWYAAREAMGLPPLTE